MRPRGSAAGPLAACTAVVLAGCSGLSAGGGRTHPLAPAFYTADMAATNRFERTHRRPAPGDAPRSPRATVAVFGTAAAVGAAGAVGALGFGVAGAVLNRRLDDGFMDGLSVAEEDRIRNRGNLYNDLTWGLGVAGLVGIAVAAITYGVDYTRCGPLAPKKRRCDVVRSRTAARRR